MNIQIEVTGSTHKNTVCRVLINGTPAGELTILREDFTRFCELLFKENYVIQPTQK